MFLVDKYKAEIINMNKIGYMRICQDGIKTDYPREGGLIAKYDTLRETIIAMHMLIESIGKTEVFFFPDEEAMRAYIDDQRKKRTAQEEEKNVIDRKRDAFVLSGEFEKENENK